MHTFRTLAVVTAFTALCWGLLFAVLSAPACAYAQAATDLGAGLNQAELDFVTKMANEVWFAIVNREWWLLASGIVTLATWVWRLQLVDRFWKDSAFDRFCDHPKVAVLTPAVLATLGGLAAAAAGTGPVAPDVLIANVVKVWAGSVAGFVMLKKLTEKPTPTTAPHPTPRATHRCKVCGALWSLNPPSEYAPEASWSLVSPTCGKCCDIVAMGEQIEPLTFPRDAHLARPTGAP